MEDLICTRHYFWYFNFSHIKSLNSSYAVATLNGPHSTDEETGVREVNLPVQSQATSGRDQDLNPGLSVSSISTFSHSICLSQIISPIYLIQLFFNFFILLEYS